MSIDINGHPIDIAMGPPLFQAWLKVVKQPLRIEMTEKEMAKFENPLQVLWSSCLYPSIARRRSSFAGVFWSSGFFLSADSVIIQIYEPIQKKILAIRKCGQYENNL
jgi:hypothetical protein